MKQFIRIYISMALFVLFGASAYAGGRVEVADDVSNGTITGQVNGTQVTLTVTPDPGYYIRKSDIVAEKTFMPLSRSKRAVPLADQLEIVGDDPEDLSLQRTYTLTLPSEEYDVLIHANFQLRGGKAEVNDAISNGTVVASIDQLTLTVVPDREIPAEKAVILKSSAATITLTPATTTQTLSGNMLQGTTAEMTGAAGNIYVLNNGTQGVGFYKLKSTGTIGANKAYLTYPGALAREFFLFDETTGIEMPTAEGNGDADAMVYDLQGRRVVNPTKGLYIVNGKKVFINK